MMAAQAGWVTKMDNREAARTLMAEYRDRGDPVGWFEPLYRDAGRDPARIPWADSRPNPNLTSWLASNPKGLRSQSGLVVGCGLGDDAELLAELCLEVTAFDISESAIQWCRQRFPESRVRYETADACKLPSRWRGAFDFVFEAYTLQVLPVELRKTAIAEISSCISPNGRLLAIARARESNEPEGIMPWPLTRGDLREFELRGLMLEKLEDYLDRENPPVRRFRALFLNSARQVVGD